MACWRSPSFALPFPFPIFFVFVSFLWLFIPSFIDFLHLFPSHLSRFLLASFFFKKKILVASGLSGLSARRRARRFAMHTRDSAVPLSREELDREKTPCIYWWPPFLLFGRLASSQSGLQFEFPPRVPSKIQQTVSLAGDSIFTAQKQKTPHSQHGESS